VSAFAVRRACRSSDCPRVSHQLLGLVAIRDIGRIRLVLDQARPGVDALISRCRRVGRRHWPA
jgi:hypothetical protein